MGQLDRYISGVHRETLSATLGTSGEEVKLLGRSKFQLLCELLMEHLVL